MTLVEKMAIEKNNLLLTHYQKYQNALQVLEKQHKVSGQTIPCSQKGLSAPFFIQFSPGCFAQKYRLLIVGQETNNCWYRTHIDIQDELFVKSQMQEYFNFTNKITTQPQSPFWRAVKYLKENLLHSNNLTNTDFMWTNLCKYDFNGNKPSFQLQNKIFDSFSHNGNHILLDEIKIYEPDIVIFMTGPSYDWYFSKIFNDSKFCIVDNFNIRSFARIESEHLPQHTYRIYHPNYLSRSKQLDTTLECIIKYCMENKKCYRQ